MREYVKTHPETPAEREERLNYNREYAKTPNAKAMKKLRNAKVTAVSRSRPRGRDLYIIKCDFMQGMYKVGRAADPVLRARNMSCGFPDQFEVAKVYESFGKHEKLVHEALSPYMVSTPKKPITEWFRLPYEELVEKINSVISQLEH